LAAILRCHVKVSDVKPARRIAAFVGGQGRGIPDQFSSQFCNPQAQPRGRTRGLPKQGFKIDLVCRIALRCGEIPG
jgi:hypothetical protein